jgi:hypothetical protein
MSQVDPAEVHAELERILSSPVFASASRHQKLLRYLVERTLSGTPEATKEYSIGVAVFERGQDFDPATDSVVRTQASLLRKRLADYYAQEGNNAALRLELPRGGYSIHVRSPAADSPFPSPVSRWWRGLALLFGGFLLGAALTLLWRPAERARSFASLPLWNSFLRDSSRCLLAINTPFFLHDGTGKYKRDIHVNSMEDWEKLPDREAYPPARPSPYAGLGEALGLASLTRVLRDSNFPMRILRGEQLRWADLKDESVIILTPSRFRGLQSEFDPTAHFELDTSAVTARLINLNPLPGEPKEFRQSAENGKGVTHALISLLPAKGMEHKILLLQGLHTWGTHGAAEFVSDRRHLESIPAAWAKSFPGKPLPEYFQILITIQIADGLSLSSHIAALRPLP